MRAAVIVGLSFGVFLAMGTYCRAEPLVIGSNFTHRIPAQGTGEAFMDDAVLTVMQHAHIMDLDVYLDITHENVIDLKIYLSSPAGQCIELKDDTLMGLYFKEEEPWSNMHGTIFDDEANLYMSDVSSPYTGRFRPDGGALSVFDDQDVYGDWTLEIYDMAYGNIGILDRWELHFDVIHTPEPSSLGCFGLLVIYGMLRKRR